MAGIDAVYDAAIRRAGMLRVFEIEELVGEVFAEITAMLNLAQGFGFKRKRTSDPTIAEIRLPLQAN